MYMLIIWGCGLIVNRYVLNGYFFYNKFFIRMIFIDGSLFFMEIFVDQWMKIFGECVIEVIEYSGFSFLFINGFWVI